MVCPNCGLSLEAPGGAESPWLLCPHCRVRVPYPARQDRRPAAWGAGHPVETVIGVVILLVLVLGCVFGFVMSARGDAQSLVALMLFFGGLILLRAGQHTLALFLPRRWVTAATVALGALLILSWAVLLTTAFRWR